MEARPRVAPGPRSGGVPEARASGAVDPALVPRPAPPPARRRLPALLATASALAVALLAELLGASPLYSAAALVLAAAATVIAGLARA